jgi:hypothetical protein
MNLYTVVTAAEAAAHWRKNYRAVLRAIDTGRYPLVARQSGKVWLIAVDSLERRWGPPVVALGA